LEQSEIIVEFGTNNNTNPFYSNKATRKKVNEEGYRGQYSLSDFQVCRKDHYNGHTEWSGK